MDILSIFITGLFAGGITCLAVQGGLLASSIAQQSEGKVDKVEKGEHLLPVFAFLVARLISYTLLGFLLGAFGTLFQLSLGVQVVMQFVVALFMIGTALNLLQVHPIFRYFVIQPPRSLTRLVKNQTKSKSLFAPALLGAFTVFIPCGATQAMMAYAIASGSIMSGGITMFAFILGTSPLFFALGYGATRLGDRFSEGFNKLASAAIIVVALYNISGSLALSGYNFSLGGVLGSGSEKVSRSEAVTEATIYFTPSGYRSNPKEINVRGGSTLKLKLVNEDGAGCIQAFTIPSYGVQKVVRVGTSDEVSITTPSVNGTIAFMCSMGMYRGYINVL